MKWRLVAIALAVLVYALVFAAAVAGSPSMAAVLVTVTVLVFLVGAGNWLQHWLGIKRRPPQFERPDLAGRARPEGSQE